MASKTRWWMALGLTLALLAPAAKAGPYLGDWGYCWKSAPGCPCGDYSFLHYWAPGLYRVKYCCHSGAVNQFPPGVPVPAGYQLYPYPCRSTDPAPSHPYADPSGYYGRPLVPPEGETKDDKK